MVADNEADLCGHTEKRSTGGTWIDGYAIDFLRSKLRNPLEVMPATEDEAVDPSELQRQIIDLQGELLQAYKALSDERLAHNNMLDELGQQRALAAKAMAAEERATRAEDLAHSLEAENTAAAKRIAESEMRMSEAERELETIRCIAETAKQEKAKAEKRADQAEQEATNLQAQLAHLAGAGFFERRKILRELKKDANDTIS